MGIGGRIWALRLSTVAVMVAAWPISRAIGQPAVVVFVAAGAALAYLLVERALLKGAWRQLVEAARRRDDATLWPLLAELEQLHAGDPPQLDRLKLVLADARCARGDYAPAKTAYEALLESPHLQPRRAGIENNLAWSMMHLGLTERALEHAREALAAEPQSGQFKGTYAVGLFLSGRAAEAVPLLEEVLRDHAGDGAETQAIRAWYLAEALHLLGRLDEARAAYERAAREAPGTRWAGLARGKLR